MESQNYGVFDMLLKKGAKVNNKGLFGSTPLELAIWAGSKDLVMRLYAAGASQDEETFSGWGIVRWAISNVHMEIVHDLLDASTCEGGPDLHEELTLHWAVSRGHKIMVKEQVEVGIDLINRINKAGHTAISEAASTGDKEMVKLLIDLGADVDAHVRPAESPLYRASQNGHGDTVELLVGHGAYLELHGPDNMTPLAIAAKRGKIAVVKRLLANGARINTLDSFKNTPLHHAVKEGNGEIVASLLHAGAKTWAKNLDQKRPIDVARDQGLGDVIVQLERGARQSLATWLVRAACRHRN